MAASSTILVLAAVLAVVLVATVAAGPAMAAATGPAVNNLETVIDNSRSWIVKIIFAVAGLLFTLGGVRYLMANGEPAEVEKAKLAFRGAGIGLALALLAPVFVGIIKSIVVK